MNRRDLIKGGALSVGVLSLGGLQSCKPKDIHGWTQILETDFREAKPLLPELGLSQAAIDRIESLLDKGVDIVRRFDTAYRNGAFKDAVTLFNNLGGIVTDLAAEFNALNNKVVKLILVSIQVARIAIANTLSDQATASPSAMAAVRSASPSSTTEIRKLAAVNVDDLLKVIQ